ncbi:MAG: ATP-binding cassette domain-containing protein [Promethearchaeota archaeon]
MSKRNYNMYNKPSNGYAIELFNLSKKYKLKGKGKFIKALDNINLKIKDGEIFGLLGPNGAGKTTLISILTTLIQPTSGYATILGRNILEEAWFIRENVGLMFGGDMIYHRLTGYKNLKFFCKLYGIKNYKVKIKNFAEKFNLADWLNQYVEYYSKGMKLKLALARVLLTEPKILLLDEPMLGLDPNTTRDIIDILRDLKMTIFLTSHRMDVVSRLCKRIAFLKEGKIIKIDTQENLKKTVFRKTMIQLEVSKNKTELIKSLNMLSFVNDIKENVNIISFLIEKRENFPELFNFLKDFPIIRFNEKEPSLDDLFIKLSK